VTRITFQDGKVVLRDGQVGTEESCCCEDCVCPPCSDSFAFSVQWAGLTATTTICFLGGSYFGINSNFTETGFVFLEVTATCENGNWLLAANLCYQEGNCGAASRYSLVVPCAGTDADGFPPAGGVALQQEFYTDDPAGCGPGGPTSATVSK
jgi:hypothetical protein